jgi:TatD DNase family protein
MRGLVDTHAHLDEIKDLEHAVEAARSAGLISVIAVGSDLSSNKRALEISRAHPAFVFPALGLHPWNLNENELQETLAFIERNVGDAVGIGEIGLDYHKRVIAVASKERQKQIFAQLLDIAGRYNKPALVHSRYAWRDCLDLVEEAGVEKAVFHWFTGPSSVLRDIISRGYYLSATPAAEYHEEHRRAVREAPLELLLLETDSPVTYGRGSQREFEARPADVRRSLAASAALRSQPQELVAEATTGNAVKLFGLPL